MRTSVAPARFCTCCVSLCVQCALQLLHLPAIAVELRPRNRTAHELLAALPPWKPYPPPQPLAVAAPSVKWLLNSWAGLWTPASLRTEPTTAACCRRLCSATSGNQPGLLRSAARSQPSGCSRSPCCAPDRCHTFRSWRTSAKGRSIQGQKSQWKSRMGPVAAAPRSRPAAKAGALS